MLLGLNTGSLQTPVTYAAAVIATSSVSDVTVAREFTDFSTENPEACCLGWHFYNCIVEKGNFQQWECHLSLLSFLLPFSPSFSHPLFFTDHNYSMRTSSATVWGCKNWSFTMTVSKTITSQIYYSFISEMWSPGGECSELWSTVYKGCRWEKLHRTLHRTQQVIYSYLEISGCTIGT